MYTYICNSKFSTIYCINSTVVLNREVESCKFRHAALTLDLQGESFFKQAVGTVQAVGCNASYIIWYKL